MHIINFELEVPFITPGSVPGVLDEPVFQAGGLIKAVADNEHGVVDSVKIFSILVVECFSTIVCVNYAARIGVDLLVISINCDGNRLLC